ncbi:cell division protein FtsQ/DivIB [Azorhizophilus paspali]|uniref:Cell division protein FtsQ n=1 Tax=Azorhizophilus paspali TaxID=69963 RepID=A0ABV6SQ34_AZOPA
MYGTMLRHRQPGLGRAPARKPVRRGASRMVAKPPVSARLSTLGMTLLKSLGGLLLLAALCAGGYFLAQRLMPYADQPIADVKLEGHLSYVSNQTVLDRIAPFRQASFFSVDLAGIRDALEGISWIAKAEVRRVWPDQLVVHLEEQLPIARWGDEALLNNQGESFAPSEVSRYEHLPQLAGPQQAQEKVMQQYHVLNQMLRPLGFSIARLELRERGSWYVTTTQGIELLLGRDHLLAKMRRFSAIYERALKEQNANIARIDLRYANGLAVAWREPVAPTAVEPAAVH